MEKWFRCTCGRPLVLEEGGGVTCPNCGKRHGMPEPPRQLTTAEVAERLGVRPVTVRVWCERGLVPGATREGSGNRAVWRIPEESVAHIQRPRVGRPRKT